MEINLSNDEVVEIILEWANEQFKRHMAFNNVTMDTGYGNLRKVSISHLEPEQE